MIRCSTRAPRALSNAVFSAAFASSILASLCVDATTFAQPNPQSSPTPVNTRAAAKTPYETTLTEDLVLVRAAPSAESGYAFGRLPKGTSVRVVEEQVGWLRVSLGGPAYGSWFGYVQAAPGVTLSDDKKSLKVSARSQVNAPNADAGWTPDQSWKPIGFLAAGDELVVIEEVKGERDTFYKVALSEKTSGWISATAVTATAISTPVTPAETTAPTTEDPIDPDTGETRESKPTTDATTTDGTGTEVAATIDATTTPTTTPTTKSSVPTTVPTNVPPTRTQIVERIKRVTFNDIDAVWKRIAKEPVETAELEQLRERFLALAEDVAASKSEKFAANSRAQQIAMRVDVQTSLREIAMLKQKSNAKIDGVADLSLAMMTRQPFDAVGRLNASTVYNGERLPLLYRLQDQSTGQTIAYILPGPTFDLSSMLGLLVGVKGPVRYDESLRLNTITPLSIDVLNAGTSSTGSSGTITPTITATSIDKPAAQTADESK
jgi:GW (Gly-Tryp) dipeptide domain